MMRYADEEKIEAITAAEYADVFRRVGIEEKERKALLFLAAQEERTSTATLIAAAMGWKDKLETGSTIGGLGGRVCVELGVNPEYKNLALVSYIEKKGQHTLLVLRPSVAQALRLL
ncbi:MAG: hypothetical protein ACYCS8_12100 [Acidithiobacillus sp.]